MNRTLQYGCGLYMIVVNMEDNKPDYIERDLHDLVMENGKLLLAVIDNKNRIDKLEKDLFYKKAAYKVVDFFIILNTLDLLIRAIFGVGIYGIGIIIYTYIVSLFNGLIHL